MIRVRLEGTQEEIDEVLAHLEKTSGIVLRGRRRNYPNEDGTFRRYFDLYRKEEIDGRRSREGG